MTIDASLLAEIRKVNELAYHKDYWGSLYEEITIALYLSVIKSGDVVIDCGANLGEHTRSMARNCSPGGTVYSFEAAPEMMLKAKDANKGRDFIRWSDKAVWHTSKEHLHFNYYPVEHGLSGLSEREGVTGKYQFFVETTTLDDAVLEAVSLIKLDIEGAEYHALLGAERIMRNGRPVIVFESSRADAASRFDYSKEDFFSLFSSRGYGLYTIAGVPFVIENWEDVACPWQFVAIHPGSPRAASAFSVMHGIMASLK